MQKKRTISLLLAIMMLFSLLPTSAFAAGSDESSGSTEKTREEVIKNTSVQLMKDGAVRTETFRQTETSVDVKVQLDDSLEQCYMTIFAYSSNTTFDPDASYNKRLWTGYVQNGQTVTCTFNQELPLYHNVIACLNVPVGEDFYRPSNSQALEVVDDSGEGFKDYTYPDASIVETALEPGANKLHIRLTGDERLFQAAKEEKTSITVAVGQYPNDGTTFDFEGEKQISLASNLIFTEPQKNYEVTLSQPLKAGWRVRAVVYWRQNESIFLAKGNDYEAMFQRPDDSVLVSGTPEEDVPAVSIQGTPKAGDTSVTVQLGGKIPDGTYIVLKKYDAGTADADCVLSGGTFLANRSVSAAGEQTLTVPALNAGDKLVAFLTNNGQIAKSQPVTAAAAQTTPLFTITPKGALTADSTQITFTVTSSDPSITSVGAFLCPVKNGSVDSDHCIARQLGQELGDITLDIPAGKLKDDDVVRLILNYEKGDDYPYYFGTEANNITVGAQVPVEDSVVLNESAFTTDATQANVTVTGCDSFRGGYLILTTGRASSNDDADSRNRLGSVTFTGPGTYTVPFSNNNAKLTSGNTIQAHLYKLDDADKTHYKYSNAVEITSGSQPAVKPEVSIATDSITANRTDIWVQTSFDGALTGTLKLYTYTGETFAVDEAQEIYSGKISSSSNSQKITFGNGKLTAGQKLIAVLALSDGTSISSTAKTVQAAPEKIKPAVQFVTKKVTAGMTKLYAAMTIDSSVNNASYTIYQFTGDTLDVSTATALSSGTLYRSQAKETVPLGRDKLVPGAKLQIVLTADGVEARSDVLTVEPSPDWGTPYAAFNVSAVKTDAKSVSVHIDYADEYIAMGKDFYCDVTIYQFPGSYSDAEFESRELWENLTLTQRVGQINSNYGNTTRGAEVSIPIKNSAKLNAGDRLIIKLRLPHTEWEGEEVDYLSASIPVVGETASSSSGGHTSSGGNSSRPSDPKPPVNDPSTGFTDVKNDAYYADAVKWAVDRGITNGQTTTLFGAEASCTRAQIVTFLWRAAGSPVPQTTKNPFTDLSEEAYYYQAVLWAVEQGITVGTTETTFDPDQTCTRGEAVAFLHRNAGEPVAAGNHGFQDVNGSDYYDNAVQWAREKSITSGTTETTFSPNARCTRGQIVTFLYRNLGN